MDKKQEYYINIISAAFRSFFRRNYRFCTGKYKDTVPDIGALVYYKWLSSEISAELPVSPYGLICELAKRSEEKDRFGFLYMNPDSINHFEHFVPKAVSFNSEEHPVINDLKLYVECAEHKVYENEYGEIIFENDEPLKKGVSSYSPYYNEYLHNTALYMGLIEPIPFISERGFRATKEAESILLRENLFDSIFEASVMVCCDKLNLLFSDNYPFFTSQIIKDLLRCPVGTDEMFSFILRDYDVDVEELPDVWRSDREADPLDDIKLSATYFLGIMLTKWFYIVFGYYLNIIRPFYSMYEELFDPMQFYVMSGNELDYNQKGALFMSVPEGYSLTGFGEKYLGVRGKNQSVENFLLPKLSIRDAFENIAEFYSVKMEKPDFSQEKIRTFIFKIYNSDKPREVKYYEFSEYNCLADVFYAILGGFPMRPVISYSIFTDESLSPFARYTDGANGRLYKNAEFTFLNEVVEERGGRLYVRIIKKPHARDKKQYYDFIAEFMGRGTKKSKTKYPREEMYIDD